MGMLGLGPSDSPDLGVRLHGYEGILRESRLFDGRDQNYSSYGTCAACPYRAQCTLCPVCIVHQPGNEDPHRVPDFVCAFNRVTANYRRRFPAQVDPLTLLTQHPAMPAPVQSVVDQAEHLRRTAR